MSTAVRQNSKQEKRVAFKITAIYLVIGASWVLFSNKILSLIISDPTALTRLQVFQGWIYVLATGWMLHMLMYRNMLKLRSSADALDERKARLRALVSGFDGLICVWSDHGEVEYVNHHVVELIGRDVTDSKYGDVLAENDKISLLFPPDEVFRGHTVRTEAHDENDGRWYYAAYTPIEHVDGTYSAMAMLLDITEQKKAEEAVRDSEGKTKAILNAIPDLMFQLDHDCVFKDCHAAHDGDLLVRPEDFLGKKASEVLPPDLAARIETAVPRALKSGKVEEFDYELAIDGMKAYFNARLVANGQDHVLCICRDVSERKHAEANYRKLALAVEQAAEAFIIADTNGCIEYVNPAFATITGYTKEEAIGRRTRFLLGRDAGEKVLEEIRRELARNGCWSGHMTNERKDGTSYEAEVVISPIRDESGNPVHYVGVSRDVTHEEELEKQFLQAQRMESVGRMAGGIAHDFNNLLLSILGVGQLILDELDEKNPIRAEIEEIMQAGESATKLTRQLLALGRQQKTELKPLKLDEVVTRLDPLLRHALGKRIQFRTSIGVGLPVIQADPGHLEQILMNLVVNARDAMPDGGELIMRVERIVLDEEYCRTRLEVEPGEYVELIVRDTGMGMTEDVRQHAFEPFFTTKDEGKGTGLGLATVYGIVQQHNGCMELLSQPGEGAEFRIYFPSAEVPVAP